MQSLLPPRLVSLLVAAMVIVTIVAGSPWPWPVRALGLLLVTAGAVLTVRHAGLFATVGTNIKTFDNPDILVRSGAFSVTRNPMYLGFAISLVGVALLLGAPLALLGPLIFVVTADRWYIPFEEARLTATFGDEYLLYQDDVRRWVGRKARR